MQTGKGSNLKGDIARAGFIDKFKEVQRLKTQLDQYTDIKEQATKIDGVTRRYFTAFRGCILKQHNS